jgi:hypothetical protein
MNERIKELLKQATKEIDPYDRVWVFSKVDQAKFAELIVRQCAMKANAVALDLRNHPELDGRKYVGDSILKAFGVEE